MTLLKIGRTLNMINLAPLMKYISWHENQKHFNQPGGVEHYKMLSYIATQLPPKTVIVDLGTYLGCSALALSYNTDITVHTYDIVDLIPDDVKDTIKAIPNINRIISDCKKHVDDFKDKLVIVLDVDPHDGVQEKYMIEKLIEVGYKGIVICDDIKLNDDMKSFWDWVPLKKYDVSKYAHWTGTGIIVFDPTTIDVVVD